MRLLCSLALLLAVLVVPSVAQARTYDVREALGAELSEVAARTSVPVRVPARLALDFDGDVFAAGSTSRGTWTLELAGAPDCGANACFLAQLMGERGGTPAFRRTVRLRGGRTGYYKPLSCGGSCSPPMIQWRQGGVLLSIQAKVDGDPAGQRRELVRAANSAIAGRAR